MTDRSLRTADDLDALAFDDRGLVPVVAQDAADGRVLMVAWADREALVRSLSTGEMHFWSRSRETLWRKGETSGNTLAVRSLHADCDADTVLARVTPAGPACHTGEPTCFGTGSTPAGAAAPAATDAPATARGGEEAGPVDAAEGADVLRELWSVLDERARTLPEGSYTTRLLADENLRLKKLGEETAELLTALAREERDRVPEEAADLLYHVLVALHAAGVRPTEVLDVLRARRR